MIYQAVTFSDFCQAFEDRGRGDQFSTDALRLIYDYLDEQSQDTEMNVVATLDVIAVCCEFAESSIEELADEHDIDTDDVRDHLDQSTFVLGETDDGTLVYVQF